MTHLDRSKKNIRIVNNLVDGPQLSSADGRPSVDQRGSDSAPATGSPVNEHGEGWGESGGLDGHTAAPQSWSFWMPCPDIFINANARPHWAKRAKLTKVWREAAYWHARKACLPKGLASVHVLIEVHKSTAQKFDAGNLAGTGKAIVDGMVGDYGLVPEDDNAHLTGPDMRQGAMGTPGVTVTITDTL